MSVKGVTFTKTWDKISGKVIASSFTPALKQNMNKAMKLNGMIIRKAIRRQIQAGVPPKNAELTAAIKGSDKALVDDGQLYKAITSKVISPFTVEVGVVKGDAYANIAAALHEGTTLKVTPAMRGLFLALASASRGGKPPEGKRAQRLFSKYQDWKPLKPSTTHIKIPGRPFMNRALNDTTLREKIYKNVTQALAASVSMGTKPPKFTAGV